MTSAEPAVRLIEISRTVKVVIFSRCLCGCSGQNEITERFIWAFEEYEVPISHPQRQHKVSATTTEIQVFLADGAAATRFAPMRLERRTY